MQNFDRQPIEKAIVIHKIDKNYDNDERICFMKLIYMNRYNESCIKENKTKMKEDDNIYIRIYVHCYPVSFF
jgi:hypothetical protein